MKITGYKYTNEQDAIDARKQCADYYGLPVHPDDITQYYVNYEIANFDNPIFYYIKYYQGTELVLGQPTTFELTTPPFPPIED